MVRGGGTKVLSYSLPSQEQHTPLTITTVAHYAVVPHEQGMSKSMTLSYEQTSSALMSLFSKHYLSFCSVALCNPEV